MDDQQLTYHGPRQISKFTRSLSIGDAVSERLEWANERSGEHTSRLATVTSIEAGSFGNTIYTLDNGSRYTWMHANRLRAHSDQIVVDGDQDISSATIFPPDMDHAALKDRTELGEQLRHLASSMMGPSTDAETVQAVRDALGEMLPAHVGATVGISGGSRTERLARESV